MALFIVEILGSNATPASAFAADLRFSASPDRETQRGVVCVSDTDRVGGEKGPRRVALFASKDVAHEVGRACHWSGQRWTVKAARGAVRTGGRAVDSADGIVSCQEA